MFMKLESPRAAIAYLKEGKARGVDWGSYNPFTEKREFFGTGDTFELQETMANGKGDESLVTRAKALIEKLELELPETEKACFMPSVAGAYPCVPDALIGYPEPMRAKTPVLDTGNPIRLAVNNACSGGISAEQFQARAACVLAIVMRLASAGRAVELYAMSTGNGDDKDQETVIAIKVETNPLSLAEAGYQLTNLGFTRRIMYGCKLVMGNGYAHRWPGKYNHGDNGVEYHAKLTKRLGFDMILPALFLDEANAISKDPVKWTLAKYHAIQAQIEAGT